MAQRTGAPAASAGARSSHATSCSGSASARRSGARTREAFLRLSTSSRTRPAAQARLLHDRSGSFRAALEVRDGEVDDVGAARSAEEEMRLLEQAGPAAAGGRGTFDRIVPGSRATPSGWRRGSRWATRRRAPTPSVPRELARRYGLSGSALGDADRRSRPCGRHGELADPTTSPTSSSSTWPRRTRWRSPARRARAAAARAARESARGIDMEERRDIHHDAEALRPLRAGRRRRRATAPRRASPSGMQARASPVRRPYRRDLVALESSGRD